MALTDGLISFWELEEASGTRDDSHGANDLTDNNTVTQAVGKVGNAAQFVSVNSEYLNIVSNASIQTGDISYSLVVWAWADTVPSTLAQIISRDDTVNREYLLGVSQTTANRFGFRTFPSVILEATSFGAASATTWYFVYASYDATANLMSISVNNGTVDTAAAGTRDPAATAPLSIGRRAAGAGDNFWNGRIDQVGFWKRILTAEEITFLFNGGSGRSYAEVVTGLPTSAAARWVGSGPSIRSLGLITSTATAARITDADPLFAAIVGVQWVSGTVTLGNSAVVAGAAGAYCTLDTDNRMREIMSPEGSNSMAVRDIFCVGAGTFIAYYQCH